MLSIDKSTTLQIPNVRILNDTRDETNLITTHLFHEQRWEERTERGPGLDDIDLVVRQGTAHSTAGVEPIRCHRRAESIATCTMDPAPEDWGGGKHTSNETIPEALFSPLCPGAPAHYLMYRVTLKFCEGHVLKKMGFLQEHPLSLWAHECLFLCVRVIGQDTASLLDGLRRTHKSLFAVGSLSAVALPTSPGWNAQVVTQVLQTQGMTHPTCCMTTHTATLTHSCT